ncbi:MAG: YicC family protein [Gammaproteobacteria bacterium]|nr:YicC family protein [Gammaproteobacteria bacterium]MCY4219821.1 YicC family protein [Gammaproteobacteria bacterium]MCY4275085.1 YicC family protein [Gammaproteobacteria bacterium]
MNAPVLQSMTGFARSCSESNGQEYVWEIRSVNHRFLNISFKLPPAMRHLETRIRDMIQAVIHRGHIEISLWINSAFSGNLDDLNQDNLDALATLMLRVHERHPELLPSSVSELLRWPGILPEEPVGSSIESLPGFQASLDQLVLSRLTEGARLTQILREKLERCLSMLDRLQEKLPDIEDQTKQKLLQRIDEIEHEVESERIAHEIALLLIKHDVTEELDRLHSHLEESISLLDGGGAVGRRLDFLMQELNREANTLGAKSSSTVMTSASIDLKLLIEQIREQIQNLE